MKPFHIQQPAKRLLIILLVLACAFYVSNNWIQLTLIQGDSMLPSYHNLQLVLLDRYHDDYRHADVIAFRCPSVASVLIKRIAACPGDTAVIENGTLLVNGQPSTAFPDEGQFLFAGLLEDPVTLEAGQYIVIGDNVSESKDSRYPQVGIVTQDRILGRVIP